MSKKRQKGFGNSFISGAKQLIMPENNFSRFGMVVALNSSTSKRRII